ncbi:hypothetical protein RhiirA1_398948 [Rhizophagus irregularis]|uniref:Uncharacterized protein n=1 Tax=Rhizophagus irregularis TaxID=588596 RepID=A0A2N0RBN6_9GLOM|nr:hypothetical protein RhiirA1_398948 [Rhizophagus irregularis]
MESAYNLTEYRYRFLKSLKESKNFLFTESRNSSTGSKHAEGANAVEARLLEDLRKKIVQKQVTIKEIILGCVSTSFEVYSDKMRRLSNEVWELRNWLKEAQQGKKNLSRELENKEREVAAKERIISKKDETIRKVSQDVQTKRLELKKVKSSAKNSHKRKGADKQKSVTSLDIDQLPIKKIDDQVYDVTERELLIYDVPACWDNDKIITIFKNLGLVRKISIKTQYKYKSVKLVVNVKKGCDDWRSRSYISLLVENKRY